MYPVECMLTWPATAPSCSFDDVCTVQCKTRFTAWITDTSSLWTWQASLNLFRHRGPGLGIQVLCLAIDN